MEIKIRLTPLELIALEKMFSNSGELGLELERLRIKIKLTYREFRRRQTRSYVKETRKQVQAGYYGRKFRGRK